MRQLRELGLIEQKGKGRGTYYIPSKEITAEAHAQTTEAHAQTTEAHAQTTEAHAQTTEAHAQTTEGIHKEIPKTLMDQINDLSSKERDKEKVNRLILQVCAIRPYKLAELSGLFDRNNDYLGRNYIQPLVEAGELNYKHPEMIKHPDQAYFTKK